MSLERAARDYGVVVREVDAELAEYEADLDGAPRRCGPSSARRGAAGWPRTPRTSRGATATGELDALDLVRHYGVIVDWGTGELFPTTTAEFRAMLARRAVPHWS